MTARRKRLAQATDVDVDGPVFDKNAIAPHAIQHLGTRVHALRIGHEVVQQLEFCRAQIQRFAIAGHAMGHRVQAQAAGFNRVVGHLRGTTAQHRLDAGRQFARREWFGDVIVSADFQTAYLVDFFATRGQHDDGDSLAVFVRLEAAREVDATHPGQHPVEDDQIRLHFAHHLLRLLHAQCADRVVTCLGQVECKQFLNCGFVFNHENVGRHHVSFV